MDFSKGESRKRAISKMWKRCKSLNKKGGTGSLMKTRSLPLNLEQYKVAPEGCFPIYVGPEKARFVIKTQHVNHHLFKSLLEEAESEYGYHHKDLLMLPCKVEDFVNVLMEMDYCGDQEIGGEKGCNIVARRNSSYQPRSSVIDLAG